MPGLNETLRLKEKADEDLYFARRDRELIAALKRRHSFSHPQDPDHPTPNRTASDPDRHN